jgi:MSHA biogenesis protein MshP
MVYLSGVQKQTANDAIQGARAYQAARAGIEWSIATINNGGNCTQINAQTALTFAGLTNFPVTLNCTGSSYSEGNTNGYIYNITSLSQYDSYTAGDYAAREISIYIVD